jgi:hypothetical protein
MAQTVILMEALAWDTYNTTIRYLLFLVLKYRLYLNQLSVFIGFYESGKIHGGDSFTTLNQLVMPDNI